MATATATTRRVAKLEGTLTPTQALVGWLTQAQQEYPSFSAYAAFVNTTANANPMLWLPKQVATWVRGRTHGWAEHVVNQEIDRLVIAILGCVALVRQMNGAISGDQHTDEIELALLETIAPVVVSGTADVVLAERWTQHLACLLHESMTWELAVAHVAERYFAGQRPLFDAEAAQLARTRARCEALVALVATRPQTARGRGRRGIDQAKIAREATDAVPDLIAQLRAEARTEVELVFGARPGLVYVQQRIAATRNEEGAR